MSLIRSSIICCCLTIVFQTPLFSQTSQDYVDSKVYEYIDGGSWCWFQDERAVVDTLNDKLIIGTANMKSGVDLTVFDIKNKRVENTKRFGGLDYSDDHNSPGVLVMPNGNYLASWAHHYDSKHRYSIYSNGNWSNERSINWSSWGDISQSKVCYSNMYYLSSEKRIYNCARAINKAPNFCYSDDNGESWKYGGQLTTNNVTGYNKGYYKYWGNGVDCIDLVLTEAHPREQGTSIYHGYIKNKKMHDSKGKVIDEDVYNNNKMPTDKDFTRVFANGTVVNGVTMGRCWQHDLVRYDDGTVAILFKARANNSETDHRNFFARFDGSDWKITYIGKAGHKIYDSEQDYTGLGALCPDEPNRIYISSPFNPGDDNSKSGKREIWRGTTIDNGATWKWQAVTANSTSDNFRPIVPKWKKGKEALLWFKGNYVTAQNITSKVIGTFYDFEPPTSVNRNENRVNAQVNFTAKQIAQQVGISYGIPEQSQVTLKVFSLSGKCVASLVNKQSYTGTYSANWNIQHAPAGTYFARLVVNGHAQTKCFSIQ